MQKLNFSPRYICIILFILAIYFMFQSISLRYISTLYEPNTPFILDQLAKLFNSNIQDSIPTYFALMLLTFTSMVLALITYAKYMNKEAYQLHWGGLAIIFLYLAMDESAEIRETFKQPLREALNLSGTPYLSFVILGAILVVIVSLVYLRLLWNLPRRTAILMILSGMIFVTGAIVIESFGTRIYNLTGGPSVLYTAIGNFEELLEMSGIILFIYTLLMYLENIAPNFQISFSSEILTELSEVTPKK